MVLFTVSDISKLIECRKKRAELLFKKSYLLWKGSENEKLINEINSEMVSVDSDLENLHGKLGKFCITLPDQEKLEELNSKISSLNQEKVYEAMKEKEGNVYILLKKRGELLKFISDKKEEIASMNMLINDMKGKDRSIVVSMLRNRDDFSEDSLEKIKEKDIRHKLYKLFARLEFEVSEEKISIKEEKIIMGSKSLWVPSFMAEKVKTLHQNIEELSRKIQYLHAKKQINEASPAEEKEFESMQGKYLCLLKEQDKIFDNFL